MSCRWLVGIGKRCRTLKGPDLVGRRLVGITEAVPLNFARWASDHRSSILLSSVIDHRSSISDQRSSCHRRSVGGLCYGTSYLWCRQNANASPHLQFVRQDLSRHQCRQDLRRHLCTMLVLQTSETWGPAESRVFGLRSSLMVFGLLYFSFF